VTGEGAIVASCHCGRVTIGLPRKPDYVNECNCSFCTKLGSRCVYFASDELTIAGEFDDYVREDIAEPMIRFRRCAHCGTMTHWEPLTPPPHERMGVNARLIDPALLEGVEIRHVDGASWT
jgi:hypothetical protein